MASSTPLCATHGCQRISRALCNCCEQYLCMVHLKEHEDQINLGLQSLADELNLLTERFQQISTRSSTPFETINRWRGDANRTNGKLYWKNNEEFDPTSVNRRGKQQKRLDQIRLNLQYRMKTEEADRELIDTIKHEIDSLNEELDGCQNRRQHTRRAMIDEDWIQPETNSLSQAYQIIIRTPGSWSQIASNDYYFCVHLSPNLCIFDHHGVLISKKPWTGDLITDICWSSARKQFLIVTEETISSFGVRSSEIDLCHTSDIQRPWFCATCSSQILFLSTGGYRPHVYEYTILPSVNFVRRWSSSIVCSVDEYIDDLKYKQGKIAMIINCRFDRPRLELRLSNTFNRLWSFHFESITRDYNPSCCPINNNQWLVIDGEKDELLLITNDGKLSRRVFCRESPRYAALLNDNVLAISTVNEIRLHQF